MICGVPAFELREAFKRLTYGWDASVLAHHLKVTEGEAEEILRRLAAEGFIEADPEFAEPYVRLTLKGGALAAASALRPIRRRKAEELLAEVVERAREINADPRELFQVSRLWVFGSYLTAAEDLGDVDVAFELARRNDWPPSPEGEHRYARANPMPRSWSPSPFNVLLWPHEAVVRRLKSKRRHLSLHPWTDHVLKTAEKKEIFAV